MTIALEKPLQEKGLSTADVSPVLLKSIKLKNLLSFGPDTPELPLQSLNLLIGPNGSGKSNLIEAICLLRSSASDLASTLRKGGGAQEWIWKGISKEPAAINAVISNASGAKSLWLRHILQFQTIAQGFELTDEQIENEHPNPGSANPYFFYHYQNGRPVVNVQGKNRNLARETVERDKSILAQRQDPEQYPEITYLGQRYKSIRAYREWAFGRNTIFREPQRVDMQNATLEEDFSNLGLYLNRLRRFPKATETIIHYLYDIYEGIDSFHEQIDGGTVQLFFNEGDFKIPATRLSDGTLRYLCLLAILCDPAPPPLICIEEPELGLHPDILPKIADLLIEASMRTQLIVTTHSDILVDAMTERPESVVVCEKHAGQTQMHRLSADDLGTWLEKYRLGQLWTRGDLGGTRW